MDVGEWFTPDVSISDVELRHMTYAELCERFGIEVPEPQTVLDLPRHPPEPERMRLSIGVRVACAGAALLLLPFYVLDRATRRSP